MKPQTIKKFEELMDLVFEMDDSKSFDIVYACYVLAKLSPEKQKKILETIFKEGQCLTT